jgi:hypothetical protein
MIGIITYTPEPYNDCPVASVDLLSFIPRDKPVWFSDVFSEFSRDHPSATYDQVKDCLFGIIGDLDWSYDPDRAGGDYLLAHTDRSYSLYLDLLHSHQDPSFCISNTIRMPGTGKPKDDRCGTVKFWKACRSNPAHHLKPAYHNCHRRECPECSGYWLSQAADRVADTFAGYESALSRYYLHATGKRARIYPPRHFSFNPSSEVVARLVSAAVVRVEASGISGDAWPAALTATFLNVLREACGRWLVAAGLDRAGIEVVHPFRIKEAYQDNAVEYAKKKNAERVGGPKYNRYSALATLEGWRDYFDFEPHVHVIAYGKAVDTNDFRRACPGVVLVNHSAAHKKSKRLDNPNKLKGLVGYLLSHAAIVKGKDAYSLFGDLHSSKLRKYVVCPDCKERIPASEVLDGGICPHCGRDTLWRKEIVRCEVCGSEIVQVDLEDGNPIYREEEHVCYNRVYEFWYDFVKGPAGGGKFP